MPHTLHVQPRDIDILQSLAEGRYLSAEALAWLHFPSWRQRYRTWRTTHEASTTWKPGSAVYDRLRMLRAAGLIAQIARSVDLARQRFARLPDIYRLTREGAELLAAMRDIPVETIWWDGGRKRSLQNVEHSVAIGTLYAALRCALEHHGKELLGWRGDHLLRDPRSYDRVRVLGQRELLPVQPDATFTLMGTRYFVEVDRNSRPLVTWDAKTRAYHAYRGSAALATRYACDDFVLLIVAPTSQRVQRIAEQIVTVTRAHDAQALLLESWQVHPIRIRANWLRLGSGQPTMQRVVNRLVEIYQPQLRPAELWAAPP
jgi:DNA-binding PadR family transcriptional regulator